MLWHSTLLLTGLCSLFTLTSAAPGLIVRSLPGKTSLETVQEVRRRLLTYAARSNSDVLFDDATSISTNLDGTVFFQENVKGVNIALTCTKCYIMGEIRAQLVKNGSFKPGAIFTGIEKSLESTFDSIEQFGKNITDIALNDIKKFKFNKIVSDIESAPPPQVDFDVDLSGNFPEFDLAIALDKTEFFMQLDAVLSGGFTYTFNLFNSQSPVGIKIDDNLLLGIVFSVDLIMSVNAQVDLSSGFHVQLGDVASLKIELFGKAPNNVQLRGGRVQFLPVTVKLSGDAVLHAILRLQVNAGAEFKSFDLSLPFDIGGLGLDKLKIGAGIEAQAFADVVDFTANLSGETGQSLKNCSLGVDLAYTFAVGAAGGATLDFFGKSFGPSASTEIPLFYTNVDICAITAKPAKPAKPSHMRRAEATTTIVTTATATACQSPGLMNCPASLRVITKNVVTETRAATAAAAQGATSFPTVDFQKGYIEMPDSSGPPVSYVPPQQTPAPKAPRWVQKGDRAGWFWL